MYVLAFHCHRYWHWFCITAVRFTSATNILIDEFGETWGFWQQFQCWRCNDTYSYAFMVMICNVMHTTDFLWGSVMAVMQYNTLIVTPLHVTVDLNLGYWSVLDGTRDTGLNDVMAFWTGANSQASFRTASQQTSRCQLNFTVGTTTAVCHILQRADLPFGCRWAARWRTSNAVLRWHSPTVGDLGKCEMLRDVACHIVAHGYICCIVVFEHFTGDENNLPKFNFQFLNVVWLCA